MWDKHELPYLDQKHNMETTKVGTTRTNNYSRKEDDDTRPSTTVRVYNWQKLFSWRYIFCNPANNRRRIGPQRSQRVVITQTRTPKKTNSSLTDDQLTRTREWRKLKIFLQKIVKPKTMNHVLHASVNIEEPMDTNCRRIQTKKDR